MARKKFLSAREQGIALITSLLFLLVVTLISVTAANSSALGLRMSANMQDAYQSFSAAEAGIYAALGQSGSAQDPFMRQAVVEAPFASVTQHPLRDMATDPNDVPVDVDVFLISIERTCPRPPTSGGGTSVGLLNCDFYRIKSEHDLPGKARTRVELGVVKTVIGGSG
ncbi:MAG: hypothetical protein HOM95_08870 [Halieaceae bacterium]|jgi:type IV pilus assembly protein PilX|nr:hypothetical protein [Halieaceae bacterium]